MSAQAIRSIALLVVILGAAATAAQAPETARRSTGSTHAAARDFVASIAAQAVYTGEIGDAMPEAFYHLSPVPGTRTFAEQLLHLAGGVANMTGVAAGVPAAIDTNARGKTKAEVLRVVADAFAHATRVALRIADADLDDAVPWQSRLLVSNSITKRQVLAVTRDHLAHHRGQLVVYLRLRGIEPPVYVGF